MTSLLTSVPLAPAMIAKGDGDPSSTGYHSSEP
jgi:hypothetical protein